MSFDNLSQTDLNKILQIRCQLPESRAQILLKILQKLRSLRSSNNVLLGKEGLVTIRDLLKLGNRKIQGTKEDLAIETFSLLGERIRETVDKSRVENLIRADTRTEMRVEEYYQKILTYVEKLSFREFLEEDRLHEVLEGDFELHIQQKCEMSLSIQESHPNKSGKYYLFIIYF